MSKQNWSDDEDDDENNETDILNQPNRDFPPSEEEDEEDEDYDMDSIRQLTLSKTTSWSDVITKKEPSKIQNNINYKNIKKNILLPKYEKRKFNPRLPPPDKYKKN